MGLRYGSDGEESDCTAGDPGSIPRPGTSLGLGNHNPLQCSCLENSMDRGAWWPTEGHNSDCHVLPTSPYGHCTITFLALKCCHTGLGLSRAHDTPEVKEPTPKADPPSTEHSACAVSQECRDPPWCLSQWLCEVPSGPSEGTYSG